MRLLLLSIGIALALFTACSRASVTTEIRGNGTIVRTLAFSGQDKKQMNFGSVIEDDFVLPAGNNWKSQQREK